MLHFMICDTDPDFLGRLASRLHELYDPCTVEYMYGPDSLEVSLRMASGTADILITEIELREKSGIDLVAQFLKDMSPLQVIYMTTKAEYCMDVYETRHCGLLLKPIRADALVKAIDRAKKELRRRRSASLSVQRGGNLYMIELYSLLYIESHARTATLVTEDGKLDAYEKIADLSRQLDNRFLQCHKSYLVNMDHVRQFCGDRFLMDNGTMIPISQSKRKDVRRQFLSYTRFQGEWQKDS